MKSSKFFIRVFFNELRNTMKTKSVTLIILFLISYKINAQEYGNWREIDSLNYGRAGHAMVLLPNGNILVSGADIIDSINTAKTCEIFDINTKTWRPTNPLLAPMYGHFMEVLNSGEILAFGGATRVCQIFNPNTEEWRLTDSTIYERNFGGETYVKLQNGNIMIMGGRNWDSENNTDKIYNECEIFDQNEEQWIEAAPMHKARIYHSSILLSDGNVLVSGGFNIQDRYLNQCEMYLHNSNTWIEVDSLIEPRAHHGQILLENNNVLLCGGNSYDKITGSSIPENRCMVFDIEQKKWILKENIQRFRTSPGIFQINNKTLILIGGDTPETWGVYDLNSFETTNLVNFNYQLIINKYNAIQLKNNNILIAGGEEWWYSHDLLVIEPSKRSFIFDITTGIIKESIKISNDFVLYQNYPNPFNPSTLLSYQIPENNYVNLTVYNSLGQTVAELVNEYQSKGKYSVEFDASNLSSGIYFYKIKAGEFSDVKKMLLTK